MSTPCLIGKINNDNTTEHIYCHWDGYPSYIAPILIENYNTIEKVDELLSLGDISVLAKNIKPITENHTFNHPDDDVVVAYHRDRGEPLNPAKKSNKTELANEWCSYIYLYDVTTNSWIYKPNKKFTSLNKFYEKQKNKKK